MKRRMMVVVSVKLQRNSEDSLETDCTNFEVAKTFFNQPPGFSSITLTRAVYR